MDYKTKLPLKYHSPQIQHFLLTEIIMSGKQKAPPGQSPRIALRQLFDDGKRLQITPTRPVFQERNGGWVIDS